MSKPRETKMSYNLKKLKLGLKPDQLDAEQLIERKDLVVL